MKLLSIPMTITNKKLATIRPLNVLLHIFTIDYTTRIHRNAQTQQRCLTKTIELFTT